MLDALFADADGVLHGITVPDETGARALVRASACGAPLEPLGPLGARPSGTRFWDAVIGVAPGPTPGSVEALVTSPYGLPGAGELHVARSPDGTPGSFVVDEEPLVMIDDHLDPGATRFGGDWLLASRLLPVGGGGSDLGLGTVLSVLGDPGPLVTIPNATLAGTWDPTGNWNELVVGPVSADRIEALWISWALVTGSGAGTGVLVERVVVTPRR